MRAPRLRVRTLQRADFPQVMALSERIYGAGQGWSVAQLQSHLDVFPEGQLIAVVAAPDGDRVLGMAASLIIDWDDYALSDSWRHFTDAGMFTNHNPVSGRTLYGAEVMTDPEERRRGVGSALYRARQKLVEQLGLIRIRAGARLRGYHRFASRMTAAEYVAEVARGRHRDPTLSFQLGRGFTVLGVVSDYLRNDPESLGWAAVIEWKPEGGASPPAVSASGQPGD